jgi:hypothetical protein
MPDETDRKMEIGQQLPMSCDLITRAHQFWIRLTDLLQCVFTGYLSNATTYISGWWLSRGARPPGGGLYLGFV